MNDLLLQEELFEQIVINQDNKVKDLLKILMKEKKKLVLYGAGHCGLETSQLFFKYGIKISYVCDDDTKRIGGKLGDTEISRIEDVVPDKNMLIFITSGYNEKMKSKLNKLGLIQYYIDVDFGRYDEEKETWSFFWDQRHKIMNVYNLLNDKQSKEVFIRLINYRISRNTNFLEGCEEPNQYFPQDILKLNEAEIFLDLGAFDGDTIKQFLKHASGKFKKIIAVEMERQNYDALINNIGRLDKVTCHNIGIGGKTGTAKIFSSEAKNSFISETGSEEVKITTIDSLLQGEEVTFVKMDIEGMESEALLGAKQTIRKNHPQMAISVYHKIEDLFELPLLVHEIEPTYKLYLRHYSPTAIETVLYAIPY